jgi:hypothetical protein
MEVSGHPHAPAAVATQNTPGPLNRRVVGRLDRSGDSEEGKILPQPGIELQFPGRPA